MAKLDYRSYAAFDVSPFPEAPCKVFTDDEIRAAYPGTEVTHRVLTAQQKHERYVRNLRAMNAASKKTRKTNFGSF